MIRTYVAIGSNLSKPLRQVTHALDALTLLPDSYLVMASPIFRSQAIGPQNQPDYLNAVVSLNTELSPIDLLDNLQDIELRSGRVRNGDRWGPRELDLDLLLYGGQVINHERLAVPHYAMLQRPFVLHPLAEISPNLVLPGGRLLSKALASLRPYILELVCKLQWNGAAWAVSKIEETLS